MPLKAPWPHLALLATIYLAFVSLGLPDGVLGVAWTVMWPELRQPLASLGLITLLLTVSSGVSTQFTAYLIRHIGTGRLVMLSGFVTALALLGFSMATSFGVLLALAIPLGLGAGAVDAGLNHFVARHYSSRHMNWLHGCWGIGATLGPLLMGAALSEQAGWHGGYRTVALLQFGMAVVLWLTLPLWQREPAVAAAERAQTARTQRPAPVALAAWLAPLTFLLYVAAEVGTGLWLASVLVSERGIQAASAGEWVSVFYAAITSGRFGLGLVANRVGNRRLIRWGIACALTGAVLVALPGLPAMLVLPGIMLTGLGCAPIYPSLMHETAMRFPPHQAATVIGRQVGAAYIGSAVVPGACGLLAAAFGLVVIMPALALVLIFLWLATEQLNRLT